MKYAFYMSRHEVVAIRKPNLSKIDSKTLFERYNHNRKDLERYRQAINYPQYLPWEKARFVAPPAGMTREEAWFLIREIDRSYRQ